MYYAPSQSEIALRNVSVCKNLIELHLETLKFVISNCYFLLHQVISST